MSVTQEQIVAEYAKVQGWSVKFWLMMSGERVGITSDEAVSEGLGALMEAPRTFRPELNVPFGAYVRRAVWNAVKRMVLLKRKEHKRAGVELTEHIPDSAPSQDARGRQVLEWLSSRPRRKVDTLVNELETGRWQMSRASQQLISEARERFGQAEPGKRSRAQRLTSAQAARFLRLPERRLRRLSDDERIAARRNGAVWEYERRDLTRYRRRKIMRVLDAGARYREAARAARCHERTVRRHAKRAGYERPRGRPAMTPETATYQRLLIWSMLSDPIAHPEAWRGEVPNIMKIARLVGCARFAVQREARQHCASPA